MTGNNWDTAAAAVIEDWDSAQQWSDARARQVQQANDGRRAVELLRQALTKSTTLAPAPARAELGHRQTADAAA